MFSSPRITSRTDPELERWPSCRRPLRAVQMCAPCVLQAEASKLAAANRDLLQRLESAQQRLELAVSRSQHAATAHPHIAGPKVSALHHASLVCLTACYASM